MVNEIYGYYLAKYIESIKDNNPDFPMLFLKDKNHLFQNIEGINVSNLYPHNVYIVESHHEFRKKFEHYKQQPPLSEPIIFIVNEIEIENKIQDFIMRSYGHAIYEIDFKSFLNQTMQGLYWHEHINEYNASELSSFFERLLRYRKSIPKSNIDKTETDLVVLSAVYDIDATKINGIVDCYLYYREILDVYNIVVLENMSLDIQGLMLNVFKSNGGELLSIIIHDNLFHGFEDTMWVSLILKQFNQLTEENLIKALGNECLSLQNIDYSELAIIAERIERKDKKLYLEKRDAAERIVRNSKIYVYKDAENYVSFVKENQESVISVIEGTQHVLKEFNLEGLKKVYKYSYGDFKELVKIVNNIPYQTKSLNNTKQFLNAMYSWINRIDILEKELMGYIETTKTYSEWISLITERLYDLEYDLSNLRYTLDKETFIETKRYEGIERRLNNVLNPFRQAFAKFVENNYEKWLQYPSEQPLLNNRISTQVAIDTEKVIFIIFDGMRYDAWKKVVEPYFASLLNEREIISGNSLALLPSITSISREAIYKDIITSYRNEVNYITKSESEVRQQQVNDSLLMTKRINILIFNMFDKEGHSTSQGLSVFYKRQKEVFEASIKGVISSLPEDVEIVIASDHGIMKINEYEKIDDANQVKVRYVNSNNNISDSIQIGEYKLSYSDKGYYSGGGERDLYSHGGASFEEIVLPLIRIKPKKASPKTSSSKKQKFVIDNKEIIIDVALSTKELLILETLIKHQLTTKDIETLLIKKLGEAGMVDGMMRRLSRKLNNTDVLLDISSAGEIIVYKLIMR